MMKDKEYCPYCGQKYMKNKHTFSKALGQILLKAAHRYKEGQGFHLIKDLELTHNQACNFQKLAYWEVVEKHFEYGIRKGGYWHLTHKAVEIIDGTNFPKSITTFNNKVMEISGERTRLKDVLGYYELPVMWGKKQEAIEQRDLWTTPSQDRTNSRPIKNIS